MFYTNVYASHELGKLPFEMSENIYKNLDFKDLLNVRLADSTIHNDIIGFFRYSLNLSNIDIFHHYTVNKKQERVFEFHDNVHKNLWSVLKFHEIEKEFLPENVIAKRLNDIFLSDDTTNRITRENSLINLFLDPNYKIINLFGAHPFEFTGKNNVNTALDADEIIQNNYQYVFLQNNIRPEDLKLLFKYIKEKVENKIYQKSYTFIPESIRTLVDTYEKYLEYQPKSLIIPASIMIMYNQPFVRIPDFIITYQKNITVSENEKIKERILRSSALVHIDEKKLGYVIASIFIIPFDEFLFNFDRETIKIEWTHIRDRICKELKTKYNTKKIFLKVSCPRYLHEEIPFLEAFKDYCDDQIIISSVLLEKNNDTDSVRSFAHNQLLMNTPYQGNVSKKCDFNYYYFFSTWYASGNNGKLFDRVLNNMHSAANIFSSLICMRDVTKSAFNKAIENIIVGHPEHHGAILEILFNKNPICFLEYFLKLPMLDQNTKRGFVEKIIENIEIQKDWLILGSYRLTPYLNTIDYKEFNFSESACNRIRQRSLKKDDFSYMPMLCFQYFINHLDQYTDTEKIKVLQNLIPDFLFYKFTDENKLLITKEFITHNDVFIDFMWLARNSKNNDTSLLIECIKRGLFEQGGAILFDLYSQCLENPLSTEYKIVDKIFVDISCDKKITILPDESLLCIFSNFLYSEKTKKYRGLMSSRLVQSVAEQIISQLIERRDKFSRYTQQNILETVLTKQLFDSKTQDETYYVNSFNQFVLNLLAQHPTLHNAVLEILFDKNPARFSEYFLKFEPKLDPNTKHDFTKKIMTLNDSNIMNGSSGLLDLCLHQSLFEKNGHILLDVFFDVLLKDFPETNSENLKLQNLLKNFLENIYEIRNEKFKNITEGALLSIYKFLSQNTEKTDLLYANIADYKIRFVYSQVAEKLLEKIDKFSKSDQKCIAAIYTNNQKNSIDPEKINKFFIRHINLFGDVFKEKWYAFLDKYAEYSDFFKSDITYYISLHNKDLKKLIELYAQFDLEIAKKLHPDMMRELFCPFYDSSYDKVLLKILNAYDTPGINNADIEVIFKNWLDIYAHSTGNFGDQLIQVFIEKQKLFLYFITIASQKEPKITESIAKCLYGGLCHYKQHGGSESKINTRLFEISNLLTVMLSSNIPGSFSFLRNFIEKGNAFQVITNEIFLNFIQTKSIESIFECFTCMDLFSYINETAELKNQLFKKIETKDQFFIYLNHIHAWLDLFILTIRSFLNFHEELIHIDFFKELYSALQAKPTREEVVLRSIMQNHEELKVSESWNPEQFCDFTLPLVQKLISALAENSLLKANDLIIADYIITVFNSPKIWDYYVQEYHLAHNDEQKEIPVIVDFLRKNINGFFEEKLSGSGKITSFLNKKLDITTTDVPCDCIKYFVKMCIEKNYINFISDLHDYRLKNIICSSIQEYFTCIDTRELDTDYAEQLVLLYRKNLSKEDIDLNRFEWFIEKYIIQIHKENDKLLKWCIERISDKRFVYFKDSQNLLCALTHVSKTYFDLEKDCIINRNLVGLANTCFIILSLDEYIKILTHLKGLGLDLEQCDTQALRHYTAKNTNNDLGKINNIIKLDSFMDKYTQNEIEPNEESQGKSDKNVINQKVFNYKTKMKQCFTEVIFQYYDAINTINKIENIFYKHLYTLKYIQQDSNSDLKELFDLHTEEKIVKFIKNNAPTLLQDPYCCVQLLKRDGLANNVLYSYLSESCDLLKQQQLDPLKKKEFDLFCKEFACALNFFTISKESMIFSYLAKNMNDEKFVDNVLKHVADFYENKTPEELVVILCTMQWHEKILPIQERFINQLCAQSNLLSSVENYKEFVRHILATILEKLGSDQSIQSLKKFLHYCNKNTFWCYFLEVFLNLDPLAFSDLKDDATGANNTAVGIGALLANTTGSSQVAVGAHLITTILVENDCCIRQFQKPETLNDISPELFKLFIKDCLQEKLCPRLQLIKVCNPEYIQVVNIDTDADFELKRRLNPQYIRVTKRKIGLDGTIKNITQNSNNLDSAIKYYRRCVPQFFEYQCTVDMLKILKNAIQKNQIKDSIAIPLLHKLKNRVRNPFKMYLVYQCKAEIKHSGTIVSKPFFLITSLLIVCGIIDYQTDFFKKFYKAIFLGKKNIGTV